MQCSGVSERGKWDRFSEEVGVVVLGAGDWTQTEVSASLCVGADEGRLNPRGVLSVGRRPLSREAWQRLLKQGVAKRLAQDSRTLPAERLDCYLERNWYYSADSTNSDHWLGLAQFIKEHIIPPTGHLLFIFALPPDSVEQSIRALGQTGLLSQRLRPERTGRILAILEKPHGTSSRQWRRLKRLVRAVFGENFYLSDHYLEKFSVNNLLTLSIENRIIRGVLQGSELDAIDIVMQEKAPWGSRVCTAEAMSLGVWDDMFVHCIQVLLRIAMDPQLLIGACPQQFFAAQAKLVRSLRFSDVLFGQYVGDGVRPGYREERIAALAGIIRSACGQQAGAADDESLLRAHGIPTETLTPTSYSAKFSFGMGRLKGVPIYARSGKGENRKFTAISFILKPAPESQTRERTFLRLKLYEETGASSRRARIEFGLLVRSPEIHDQVQPVILNLDVLEESGGQLYLPYTKLIIDALGDRWWNFAGPAVVSALWSVMEAVKRGYLSKAAAAAPVLKKYLIGTEAPTISSPIFDGRRWVMPQSVTDQAVIKLDAVMDDAVSEQPVLLQEAPLLSGIEFSYGAAH